MYPRYFFLQADNLYTQVIDSHATFRVLISAFGIPRLKDHAYHPEHLREELENVYHQKSALNVLHNRSWHY
ncbi:hypothetical protein FD724_04010 [Nostoc sp. C057]|uniref:hypothetical protein n=1 Tax=Nostoc sp. C057 TaxID=2576903 RepID=UPI0015C358D4|nr:hypothetical protein [Nostoc sp. C057]QLE47368.1 hypothetical protein FD724_04010 [Nostoc sp. C057]